MLTAYEELDILVDRAPGVKRERDSGTWDSCIGIIPTQTPASYVHTGPSTHRKDCRLLGRVAVLAGGRFGFLLVIP
jgi:hypothetical protein